MSAPVDRKPSIKQRRLAPGERAWPRPCDTVSAPPACWWWSNASCWSATRSAATSTGFRPAAASSRNATNRRRIPSGASFRGDRPAGGRRPAGLRARIRRTRRRALPHGAVLPHRRLAWRADPGQPEGPGRRRVRYPRGRLDRPRRTAWPAVFLSGRTGRRRLVAPGRADAIDPPPRPAAQTLTAPDRWWGSRGSPSAPRSWGTPGSTPWAGSAAGTSAGRCPVSRPSDTARPGSR